MDGIRLAGDAVLTAVAEAVVDVADAELVAEVARLHAALAAFRAAKGFGRAIAAPQIGVSKRFVALDLGSSAEGTDLADLAAAGPFTIFNPAIVWRSDETMTLWDNCLSFPWLMVRTQRAVSISVTFQDADGVTHTAQALPPALSELLQHELDHLDGVLALDKAIRDDGVISFVARNLYDADPARYNTLVDYAIEPTV
ncbi:polypeptide deformylase [Thecamonas trahens ATCC 50062]|uniref:Peptide deformylase n=1 Tax=Thecamonas trahens ATCC 50062 TaxID=461836 RepID=A0A0L0D6A1_THETB|nr:polypeptide deformylase [Thecamonas trahens ATCC 50062]KNC47917.1 polypeptide deformylase [Thecamonas trahens ATCC 50062]|eukprot:XP_013758937.1 polypeptide deformylase [Thecamonas trahens ATCC 50062]